MAATRKCTDDAHLKSLQVFFAPAPRARTDTHTAYGADGTLAQDFAAECSSPLGKVGSAGIKDDVAHSQPRRNGLSGNHYHFSAFRNRQKLRDGGPAHLSGTTKNDCSEILRHK